MFKKWVPIHRLFFATLQKNSQVKWIYQYGLILIVINFNKTSFSCLEPIYPSPIGTVHKTNNPNHY